MDKEIVLSKKEIDEILNVNVDVKNGDVNSAIKAAKAETDKAIGSSTDRNYVISGDELNENSSDSIIISKSDIEKARLKKALKNGCPLTKKELKEAFIRLNELSPSTYLNASNKSKKLGQVKRSDRFRDQAEISFTKELGRTPKIRLYSDGFDFDLDGVEYGYNINNDEIYMIDFPDTELIPGDIRTNDRFLINDILFYFKKFNPNSKYNNKNMWVA